MCVGHTAEHVEMPLGRGGVTHVGPRNRVSDEGQNAQPERAIFGVVLRPTEKQCGSVLRCVADVFCMLCFSGEADSDEMTLVAW